MQLIRIFCSLLLLLVGALLGDGYKNSLFLYWLITSGLLLILIEWVINKNFTLQNDLIAYKDKVSSLVMLKSETNNFAQISFYPTQRIVAGTEVRIDLYATFATTVTQIPDIKIKTNTNWVIRVFNQVQQGQEYAGKYEYFLSKHSMIQEFEMKFVKYSFYVTVYDSGNHNFLIELDNGLLKSELGNSIKVFKS